MAFRDSLKKYREAQVSQSTTTSGTSKQSTSGSAGGGSGSFRDSLAKYRAAQGTDSVQGWIETSINLVNDVQTRSRNWFDNSEYLSQYDRITAQLAMADAWRKKYAGNDEAISHIDSVVDALTKAKNYSFSNYNYYSQWEDEDKYFKGSADTRKDRQQRYNDNLTRIAELEAEIKNADDPFTRFGVSDRAQSVSAEIAKLRSENRKYERGEDGWASKTMDDYYGYTDAEDFENAAANRNFTNPTREDLAMYDSLNNGDTWYFDANGVYRDAYGNELIQENGTWVNPAAKDEKYKVTDRLGMYLSATEAEISEAGGMTDSSEGSWAKVLADGEYYHWGNLTEQETGIYYYLLNTQGAAAADKFLDDMEVELAKRETNENVQKWAEAYDDADALGKIFLNAVSVPANVFGGAVGFIDDAGHTLLGEEINPYNIAHGGMHYTNTVRGMTAADLDETGFEIPGLDFSLGDIYQVGMSRLDSALATGIGGGAGTLLLGMGSATNEAYRLYQAGASSEQITWGALTAGAAEVVFEYASFDKLVKMKDAKTVGQWVISALIQGGIEASEEGFTEIANTITNAIIMGSESDLAKLYEKNGGNEWKTFLGLVQQTSQAAFGGFLGGFGAGATQGGKTYINTQAQYADAGRTIMGADGGVDALMNLANEVAGVSSADIQKKLTKQTGKVEKKATARRTGRLYDTVQNANNLANASLNQADIAKSLERKGFNSETANDIADALVANYNGHELTIAQSKLLKSAKDSKVVQEAISNIIENEQSTMGQRSQNIRDFSKDVALGRLAKAAGVSVDTVRKMAEGNLPTTAENTTESHYEVSEDGQMENTKTGDVIEPQGLVQAEDGTYKIAVKDADPVSPGEVSYADNNQALVYETFVNLEKHSGKISKVISNMNLKSRNELIGLYNPKINKDGGTFVNGILDAYFYGHRGIDMATASKDSPMFALTPEQRAIAWNTGKADGIQSTTEVQSNVDSVYAEAKEILESGKAKKGSYHAVLEDGISPMQLNKAQKATYRLADEIAQGVQTNIRVYAGKDKAQGFYNHETDEIWLNLNAADTGREAIMAFTLTHEIVHRSKKGSPAKYQAFVDFLMKEYGKQGSDVEAMIAEQIAAAERFNKTVPDSRKVNMTREKALEEVVCDACQRMLLDTNAGQKLAEFGARSRENKSFLEDLKRWITELLDKLRRYFKNAEPDSLAAKEFAKFDANVKQILADMYVDMSIEAGEKLSTIKAAYGGEFAQKFHGLKDISYNLAATESHKDKLQKEYSEDSSTDLDTIMKRYDKILDIWTRLGGDLNSKFLADWNSKVSKDRSFTIFKAQAGYKYNVELSSMCKKGVPLFEAIDTIVKKEVMKELELDVLGKAEKEILYDILKQHHFEIPCAICYVEQARQREGVIIDAFLNGKVETDSKGRTTKEKLGWNQVLESIEKEMKANGVDYSFAQVSRDIATEKYTPANLSMDSKTQAAFYVALKKIANKEIARYNKAEGKSKKLLSEVTPEAVKECFKGTLPANLKIFKVLFEEPSSRFKIQKDLLYSSVATQNLSMAHNKLYGLFNSQGGVSGYKTKQGTTIYWGDILGKTWKPDTLRNEGGVRNQSNSDFQMYTLLDQAQMYIDFTAKGYYLQAYTKVLSELKLFGLSRGKINASLIPKVVVYRNADGSVDIEKTMATAGLDENGNPIYDDIEGINHDEAFMLIEDPEYSKSICGICIGYSDAHINKLLDDSRVQQIIGFHDKTDDGTKRYKGARYAKNYNGLNEAVNKEGKTVHIGFNPYVKRAEKKFQFNAETETYEGTVKYNGKTYTADDIPRLATDLYLEMCAKKEYTPAYKDFAGHRNYYKLLADFGLYDSQGHYAPHRKVVYNMPDTVPYLDADGKKQTMKTYDYIKSELEKELTVRDSIAEALADTSDEGIIPKFKAAVKKSQEEKSFSLPKVFSDSIERFGTTTDFEEAGFILPSGEMLKFTDDKHRGERQYDHRAIGMVYGIDVDLGVNHGFNKESGKFLDEFVENGGIRFDAGDPDLDMDVGLQLSSTVPITKAQEQLIRDLVKWKQNREELFEANLTEENFLYTGPLAIRIDFGGDSQYAVGAVSAKDLSAWGKKSLEYDGGNINADRIIADIRHYYQTGETRQQSLVSQFHYSYSLPKITEDMTETERYEILKDATISVQSDDGSAAYIDQINSLAELGDKAKSKAEKIIIPLAKDLGILNKSMSAADVDIEFIFSKGNGLQESLSKQLRYGGNYADFAKTIINLDKVINSAVLIEKHGDKYKGTSRENRNLEAVFVMVSAFRDGDYVIPIQLEIKKASDVGGRLYLTVAMTKIEASVLGGTIDNNQAFPLIPASITYNLADIFREINPKDRHFLKYLPDGFLSEAQKEAKRMAIEEDNARIASYKLPVGEDTSPRALLANAFEGIVTNDIEKRRLQEYKGKVEMLNAEEQKLHELRAEIKELSFAKGKRDTQRIKDLQFDAIQTANRIATLDKTLLRLEAAAPLQSILQREKQMAYKRAEQKGKEALEAYRKAERERDKQWQSEVKEKYQASKKKAIETRDKREAREKLQQLVIDTAKWISYPSKTDVKCPDILKQPYADFLNSIDLSSQRLAKGGDPTKNDLRLANAMSSLATALDKVMTSQDPTQETTAVLDTGYLDLPANFVQKLRDMTEDVKAMMGDSEYVVNNMPAEEIRKLSQMIRTLNHAIKEVSTLYANLRFANVEALGDNTMSFIDALGEIEKTGGIKDFVQWDNALPYYAFKRFGEGGESIFEGLMDAQDKLAFLAQQIFDFQEKVWTGKEAKAWSEDTHTINLPNGSTLTLTTSDAMSIYCLSRRQQGLQHLLGGGTRVMGIQKGSQKAKDSRSLLTIKDIEAIISSLTDRQKQVADAIQEFMSTTCSEWGNEISMKRFLTKEFNEKFYFPIESNDENLATKDPSAQRSDLFRLLNISATKPIDPRANNEVIIRNIFDVFTNHASDMARLNAYGMALLDYMKWLNYREKTVNEEGQIKVRGVRKSMESAYGAAAKSYVLNLVKDVNGRPSDGGDPTILMKWMRTAKTASVGSSLRVATLQITSYPRAALVLSPKSLALGLSKLPQIDKAKKYCGVALWKSFGFYDTNISRSIEDQMKGVKDVRQKLIELSLKGAEIGDAITWGALWNACEYEVASTKKYKVGTEEFYQAVGKKLREVVYRTQVVDSTLTRSQIMRSKRGMAQEAAAFMSEPTVSANILMDAGFQFSAEKRRTGSVKAAWKKTGPYIAKAVAVYSIGQLTAALLEGLWDAWRDDEDEEFGEKYLNAFVENLILDLVPFNKIPIVSDVFEAVLAMFDVGFYSSDKMSTTWLTQAVSAVDAWKTVLSGESSTTAYNALYKTVRAISSFVGVSFSGVMREGVALWNNTAGAYDTTLKIRQYELSKADLGTELYEAIISGNTNQANSLKAQFEDPDSMSTAIRKALRENDPRIKEAAQAQVNGDPSERVRIAKQIVADGFAQDDVVRAINAEINAMTSSDSSTGTKKESGFYTATDFAKEIANGDHAAANAAKVDIIQTAQKNGKTKEEAEKSFNSSAKTELKNLFLAGKISEQDVINALTSYCDAEQDDAMADVQYWSFKQDYPDVYADDSWFDTYYEKVADSGISIDVYMEYRNTVSTITGEGKKEKRMAVIHSLPISSYQKDALYYAEGWAESKLYEAPWH